MTIKTERLATSLYEFLAMSGLKIEDLNPDILELDKIAKEIGWPRVDFGYPSDLYQRDFDWIQENNPREYVMCFTSTSTYRFHEKSSANPNMIRRCMLDNVSLSDHFYIFENHTVRKVSREEAVEWLYGVAQQLRVSVPTISCEISVPTLDELLSNLDWNVYCKATENGRNSDMLTRIYCNEITTMLQTARQCKKPRITMNPFVLCGGTQWLAEFSVCDMEDTSDKYLKYNGCIMISSDGSVSSHH